MFKIIIIFFSWVSDAPAEDSEAVGDPYKTLFISRLVSEKTNVWNMNWLTENF